MCIKTYINKIFKSDELPRPFFLGSILLFLIILPFTSNAQCAMCRAAIESEGSPVKAEAINDGIVYLMVIPYILVAVIGYLVYRMYKKKGIN